jgi:hypothetical protein
MSRETKFHSAAIASMAVVLAVLAVKWFVGAGEVPATSISDQRESRGGGPAASNVTHQPTILKAQATHAPPVEKKPAPPPTQPGFQAYISDENSSTWCEASSAGFLPLPSPNGLKQH